MHITYHTKCIKQCGLRTNCDGVLTELGLIFVGLCLANLFPVSISY
jgi:hypothetical protein